MQLTNGWQQRLSRPTIADRFNPSRPALPLAPDHFADRVRLVDDAASAAQMLSLLEQRALSHIGFDIDFRYDRPGVVIDQQHIVYDPSSINPLLLAIAAVEPDEENGDRVYRFVVDLRVQSLNSSFATLFRLPYPFVGYFIHEELLCLLKLNLSEPRLLWDTWVHERTTRLGRAHRNYRVQRNADVIDLMCAAQEIEAEEDFHLSLAATCRRYGVSQQLAGTNSEIQRSFLAHGDGMPFLSAQMEYASADAEAAAALYSLQVSAAARAGVLQHLIAVEMPWIITNARMAYHGVRVDREKCRRVEAACERHLASLEPGLAVAGVGNILSHDDLKKFFSRAGILELFRRNGGYSFDKNALGDFQDRHPLIPAIRAARRAHDIRNEKILSCELVGSDGRIHPQHRQLGTHTGRQTSNSPNILGLGRIFRPLIVPNAGNGIGEVDWAQFEVGIAAAVYGDDQLVQMFNTGDIYSAMAQFFFVEQLSEDDRRLPSADFKKKHAELRSRMKTCTLGIIYGLTAHGMSPRLGVTVAEASRLKEKFLSMFPVLKLALANAAACGAIRGYAAAITGLRRYRAERRTQLSNWEGNWLVNHPVQGSAAVIFKAAGNRLDKLYRPFAAKLIIPLHDAFVFEAPLPVLDDVADLTAGVMKESVQEYFPQLRAQVEISIAHPQCWHKDGHADSVERWIENPLHSF